MVRTGKMVKEECEVHHLGSYFICSKDKFEIQSSFCEFRDVDDVIDDLSDIYDCLISSHCAKSGDIIKIENYKFKIGEYNSFQAMIEQKIFSRYDTFPIFEVMFFDGSINDRCMFSNGFKKLVRLDQEFIIKGGINSILFEHIEIILDLLKEHCPEYW